MVGTNCLLHNEIKVNDITHSKHIKWCLLRIFCNLHTLNLVSAWKGASKFESDLRNRFSMPIKPSKEVLHIAAVQKQSLVVS